MIQPMRGVTFKTIKNLEEKKNMRPFPTLLGENAP